MAAPKETSPLLGSEAAGNNFNWMPVPQATLIPGCPAGLECLVQIDRLLVSRFREGFLQPTRTYRVRNTQGQDVYYIEENPTCACDQPYSLTVTDCYQRQVAQFVTSGSMGCGLSNAMSDMEAEAPPGNVIGGVHQDYMFAFQQWFSVVNAEGQTILKITKSMGNFFSPEVDFKILSSDGNQEVGVITRQWPGLFETFFNFEARHTFGISFPMDLDVKMKAVMILAALIIDRYYFEQSK